MKKVDYVELPIALPAHHGEIRMGKKEDTELPSFTKEIPIKKSKEAIGERIRIAYTWNAGLTNSIKISEIEFRTGEQFENMPKLPIQDGEDTALFTVDNLLYLIRKTASTIARSLFTVYSHIKSVTESIVGYFRTLLGNSYIISKLEPGSWSFDHVLTQKSADIRFLNPVDCTPAQKDRLVDLISKKLSFLHSRRLVFGPLSLRNVILTDVGSYLTDLRSLRLSRKSSLLVIYFKNALKTLFSIGIATSGNVYPAVAAYCVMHETACMEWYREKSNQSQSVDLATVAHVLESEIIS